MRGWGGGGWGLVEAAYFPRLSRKNGEIQNLSNKNHFVNFAGATFVLATHVEGSFSSTSLSGDMKIFFIANIL